MTKNIIKQSMSVLLAVSMALASLTGIPAAEAQAATAKPVIKSSQVKIKNNSCTVKVGKKVNLTAKSGKTNVTKKGTWKSSKKTVATISKTGKLTAKKAGTTNITITYKKKTSKKLKVVVKKNTTAVATPKPTETSNPTTTAKPVPGAHTVKYNSNGGTLSGSNTQSVSGEILNFPDVSAPTGKRFIGWYDKKSGGNRIYETYVPTGNVELYAHYTDKETQKVQFVTECNYGDTYSFMSDGKHVTGDSGNLVTRHDRDYDWLNSVRWSGPLLDDDYGCVSWNHEFELNSNNKITIESLPTPEVPGYTFVGWYTSEQNYLEYLKDKGSKVESGQKLDKAKMEQPIKLYARFTKKITISFDDFRGNKYDDIVVDSYSTIAESGATLPVPKIPGATFLGWTMDKGNHDHTWVKSLVKDTTTFYNCIEWYGIMCSGCGTVSKDYFDPTVKCLSDCDTHFSAWNDDWHVYEETDHFTLYPAYKYDDVTVTFDPSGGRFSNTDIANQDLRFTVAGDYTAPAYRDHNFGSQPYGAEPYGFCPVPGHEEDEYPNYGSGNRRLPVIKRDYYEFDGWYYLDDKGKEQEFKLETILTGDMQVYAKWKPGKSTVWFSIGVATGDSIPDDEMQAVGLDAGHTYKITTESSVSEDGKRFPIPVNKDGREFLGWTTIDDEPFTEDMPVVGMVRLFAAWGPLPDELPIKLDFDPNGGTFDDETFENNISGLRGTPFYRFPSVSKDDCDFLGWYALKPGATDYNDDASFIQMVRNPFYVANDMVDDLGDDDDNNDKVTLVARWAKKAHVTEVKVSRWIDHDYVSLSEDDEPIEVTYTGANSSVPLELRGVALPQTVSNRNIIWSSSNQDLIYIDGAGEDGTLELKPNWDLESLKFGKEALTPTREGYDVVLTATAADVDPDDSRPVTFNVKVHISFPEDQIPVTVTFDAGDKGLFWDGGVGYQNKVYDVKRSQVLLGVKGLKEPTPKDAKKYEFIGWKVTTADGEEIDVTDDMRASDFDGLDEIKVMA